MERVYEGVGRWIGYMRVWNGGEGVRRGIEGI